MSHSPKQASARRSLAALVRAPGALLFALALALAMGFYAWSILDSARRTTDWLLIVPAALVGIAALVFALTGDLKGLFTAPSAEKPAPQAEPGDAPASGWFSGDVVGFALMLLVLGYALALPWLGFDLGTFLFVALALLIQGERRWLRLVFVSILSAGLFVYVFKTLLGVRLPTLFL